MPTKAITPAEATQTADKHEATASTIGTKIDVRIPNVWASTEPSSSIFSRFPKNGANARNTKAMVVQE